MIAMLIAAALAAIGMCCAAGAPGEKKSEAKKERVKSYAFTRAGFYARYSEAREKNK